MLARILTSWQTEFDLSQKLLFALVDALAGTLRSTGDCLLHGIVQDYLKFECWLGGLFDDLKTDVMLCSEISAKIGILQHKTICSYRCRLCCTVGRFGCSAGHKTFGKTECTLACNCCRPERVTAYKSL